MLFFILLFKYLVKPYFERKAMIKEFTAVLLEDNPLNIHCFVKVFNIHFANAQLLCVKSLDEAKKLDWSHVDILVTDFNLVNEHPIEFVAEKHSLYPEMKIILWSANMLAPKLIVHDVHIQKPVSFEVFIRAINELLGSDSLSQELPKGKYIVLHPNGRELALPGGVEVIKSVTKYEEIGDALQMADVLYIHKELDRENMIKLLKVVVPDLQVILFE